MNSEQRKALIDEATRLLKQAITLLEDSHAKAVKQEKVNVPGVWIKEGVTPLDKQPQWHTSPPPPDCAWDSIPLEDRDKPMGLYCPCPKCSPMMNTSGAVTLCN